MASELSTTTARPGVWVRCPGQQTAMNTSTPINAIASASPPSRGVGFWCV